MEKKNINYYPTDEDKEIFDPDRFFDLLAKQKSNAQVNLNCEEIPNSQSEKPKSQSNNISNTNLSTTPQPTVVLPTKPCWIGWGCYLMGLVVGLLFTILGPCLTYVVYDKLSYWGMTTVGIIIDIIIICMTCYQFYWNDFDFEDWFKY